MGPDILIAMPLFSPPRCPLRAARRRRRLAGAATLLAGVALVAVAGARVPAPSLASPSAADDPAPIADEDVAPVPELVPGARVIVREIGRRRHAGTLEVLSDDVVVIRDPEGEVRSFPQSRVVAVTALLPPDSGREMAVVLVDGVVRTGFVLRDDWDRVVLSIEGVRVPIPRNEIARTRILPTFSEELAHRRALLDESDPEDWTGLVAWIARQERWALAEAEATRLLKRHPRAREADRLRRVAAGQLALAAARERGVDPTGADADGRGGRGADEDGSGRRGAARDEPRGDAFERRVLTPEEVNLLRVYEIDFRDPPRVAVPREVVRTVVEQYGDSPLLPADDRDRVRLHQAEPIDLVRLIFELRARELYGGIRVISEPRSLREFRRGVHDAWLVNVCGACHAEPNVGGFRLHAGERMTIEAAMTNLLVVDRHRSEDDASLIDWDHPERSRLLQYALPRFRARTPHPPVEGFRPAFGDLDDRRARRAIQWIESMYRPRPEYPIEFDPVALVAEADAAAQAAARDAAEPDGGERDTAGRAPSDPDRRSN